MSFSKQQFELRLEEFFERHDPAKIDMAHRIANRFHLHQEDVFHHLTKVYDRNHYHQPENFLELLEELILPPR